MIELNKEEREAMQDHINLIQRQTTEIDRLLQGREREIRSLNFIWKTVVLRAADDQMPEKFISDDSVVHVKIEDGNAVWRKVDRPVETGASEALETP